MPSALPSISSTTAEPTGRAVPIVLVGGRTGALDGSVPGPAFVIALVTTDDPRLAVLVSIGVAAVLGVLRGRPPRAALLGLLGPWPARWWWRVLAGRGLFLLQLLANGVSAVAWTLSSWLRRPCSVSSSAGCCSGRPRGGRTGTSSHMPLLGLQWDPCRPRTQPAGCRRSRWS